MGLRRGYVLIPDPADGWVLMRRYAGAHKLACFQRNIEEGKPLLINETQKKHAGGIREWILQYRRTTRMESIALRQA